MNQESSNMNNPAARNLLGLALTDIDDPLAEIFDAVARDGEDALRDVLDRSLGSSGQAEAGLLHGDASLDQLLAWKTRAKLAWQASGDAGARGAALLLYLLCIAAALAHYGQAISSLPREEVEEHFVSMAGALPPRWERMITRALYHD